MADNNGKYKSDDNVFLDFGPEPVDEKIYDEVVNKELDAAREREGAHKGIKLHGAAPRRGSKKIKTAIKIAIAAVVSVGALYVGANIFLNNYYGDNDAINAVKYEGNELVQGSEQMEAFDSIDIDINNCQVTVESSYDDEFHVSYKIIAKDADCVKLYVEERAGSRVLTCDIDNKKTNDSIWKPLDGDDYEYQQYLRIMLPEGDYKNFTLRSDGGCVDVYHIEGGIEELDISAANSDEYASISGVKADRLKATLNNQYMYIRDSEFDTAVIEADMGLSIYDSKVETLLDINSENEYTIVDNIELGAGGKLKAAVAGEDLSVTMPGEPELYHLRADAENGKVYCSQLDYYGEGLYELGDGSREVELINKDKGIFLYFEVDE